MDYAIDVEVIAWRPLWPVLNCARDDVDASAQDSWRGWMSEDIEQRVLLTLGRLGVPYEVIKIDPAYADTAEFCAKYGFPLDHSGNTIICASKKEPKRYSAGVVLATTRLDVNHAVRKLMGVSRVSFASGEETRALTGMMIGGVTVFALPEQLPIYVDRRVMSLDYVIVGAGSRSSKIRVSPEALLRLPNAQMVEELATAAAAVQPPFSHGSR
jgi:prolyl-tRNA editing enzyme YbaK/EbsC (Cys-tRNA(Pro) deacylase)